MTRIDPFYKTMSRLEHATLTAAAREARAPRITTFGEQEVSMTLRSMATWNTLECAGTHDTDNLCPKCCDHSDMEDAHCLDCGEDRTEDLMAAAYDRAKASRYE